MSDGPSATLNGIYNDIIVSPLNFTFCLDTVKLFAVVTLFHAAITAAIYTNVKNYRNDEEYGSAKWADTCKINKRYRLHDDTLSGVDRAFQDKLMTSNVRLGFDTYRHERNLNTLVLGGSGSKKSRALVMPNILQMNTSFVVTDPKGELAAKCGGALIKNGYRVVCFDVANPHKSACYNPFCYFRNDNDILIFVYNYFAATGRKNESPPDPFWEDQAKNLMLAFCTYLYHEAPPEEQNLATVLELLHAADVKDDEDYVSPVDLLFLRLGQEKPGHVALKFYKDYHKGPAKTIQCVQSTLSSRLALFNIDELAKLTMTDDIDIRSFADRKTALFCVTPEDDKSKDFLIGCLYQQMFQQLYDLADYTYHGPLPEPVQFYMDEFANIALPDDYNNILSTARSRNISFTIILQDKSQIEEMYEKLWKNIFGNCDEILFLGSNEKEMCEYISELCGEETVYVRTFSKRYMGLFPEYTENINKQGRKLITPDELRRKSNDIAILIIRGEDPVRDLKINLKKHPNYGLLAEGKNLKRRKDPAEIYEWDKSSLAAGVMSYATDADGRRAVDIKEFRELHEVILYTADEILKSA